MTMQCYIEVQESHKGNYVVCMVNGDDVKIKKDNIKRSSVVKDALLLTRTNVILRVIYLMRLLHPECNDFYVTDPKVRDYLMNDDRPIESVVYAVASIKQLKDSSGINVIVLSSKTTNEYYVKMKEAMSTN